MSIKKIPDWRKYTKEQLDLVEVERKKAQEANIPRDPKGTYKLMCPICTKPNSLAVDFCTGCSFSLNQWDAKVILFSDFSDFVKRQSDNIFLDLIRGIDIGTPVHYRSDKFLIFDDKFGVSTNHIQVIPIQVIDNITFLNSEHIPMLEEMYRLGVDVLRKNLEKSHDIDVFIKRGLNFEDFIISGYNHPVSVKHLHLHLAIPPWTHEKVFQYPRWHSKDKVLNDLRKYGRVHPYDESPNDEEGNAVYDKCIRDHRKILGWITEAEAIEAKKAN